ncbi:MAG TPA: S8 family peptidase [Actinomycetota bacterium]
MSNVRKLIALAAVLALGSVAPASAGTAPETARTREPVSVTLRPPAEKPSMAQRVALGRELIVRFRSGAADRDRAAAHLAAGALVVDRVAGRGLTLVRVPEGVEPAVAMRAYRRSEAVAFVEPNVERPLLETVPNDPLFPELWGLRNTGQAHGLTDPPPPTFPGLSDADIDAGDAWDATTGSSATVVAVIDTGIDLSHPDLAPNLWVNADEIPANGIDDDANGYVDDVNGWDFIDDDAVPQDTDAHGSHVSGTIAAAMNNTIGVAGVCPGCRIMPLRFDLDVFTELRAIDYAIANGAHIINASFGGDVFSKAERNAIGRANDAGILFVAAAGNEFADLDIWIPGLSPSFPAAYDLPGIVSVGASNDYDEIGYFSGCALAGNDFFDCVFSNFGHDAVDLFAPGVDILSTVPGSAYAYFNGTSMASPHVAGVAGLVKSLHPDYTPLQLRNALLNSVDTAENLTLLADGLTLTDGRVNAAAALNASTATTYPVSSGNIQTAQTLRSRANGRVSFPGNVNDVFKKRLRKGARYAVFLDVPRRTDLDLFVWKPGTFQIFQGLRQLAGVSGDGAGRDELVVFKARKAGIYYFHVEAFFDTGRYTLEVARV